MLYLIQFIEMSCGASRALEEIWKSDRPRSKRLAAKQQMVDRSTKESTLVRGTNLQKLLLNSAALATQIVDTIAVGAHTAGFRSHRQLAVCKHDKHH